MFHKCTLHFNESDREIIETFTGWLNDKIIDASQKLLAQHFPLTSGLEPPTLEQINGFRAHTDNFIQTLRSNSGVGGTMSRNLCNNYIFRISSPLAFERCAINELKLYFEGARFSKWSLK